MFDLYEYTSSRCDGALLLQYADDTTVVSYGPNPEAAVGIINHQLSLIHGWLVEYRIQNETECSEVVYYVVLSWQV